MPGSTYKRGEIYWIKFYHKGKKYKKSAKTNKKREAQDLLAFYMGQVVRGEFKGFEEDSLSMKELFDAFQKDCERRKLRGLDIIGYHLKPVRAWFEKMDVDQVSERDISRYINHRLDQGRSTTTVNRELQYLGQTLRLAKRRKLIKEIPYIEKFSEKENARQGFFEREDFERLVSFLPEDLKDYVRFGYVTGWRKGEVAKLEWQHVKGDTIRLPPYVSKNKDGRVLMLVGELAEIIERRRAVRGYSPGLLP